MKKQIIFIISFTIIFQFLLFYIKNKSSDIILSRSIFITKEPNHNYSKIFPLAPEPKDYIFYDRTRFSYKNSSVKLISAGTKIYYVGMIKSYRNNYYFYKIENEIAMSKINLSENLKSFKPTANSLEFSVENNSNLISQIKADKGINNELCINDKTYSNNGVIYLKKMLSEYNLTEEIKLGATKEATFNYDKLLCINTYFKTTKSFFFMTHFIANRPL